MAVFKYATDIRQRVIHHIGPKARLSLASNYERMFSIFLVLVGGFSFSSLVNFSAVLSLSSASHSSEPQPLVSGLQGVYTRESANTSPCQKHRKSGGYLRFGPNITT